MKPWWLLWCPWVVSCVAPELPEPVPAQPGPVAPTDPRPCDAPAVRAAPIGGGGNILLLVVDDLGVDKLGVYGEHPDPPPTPEMDRLAGEGVLFRNAWANPTCSPSRASLLTGRHARRSGIGWWIDPVSDTVGLPDEAWILPEMLAESGYGYTSALVGKWHLSVFHDDAPELDPIRQGFHTFRGILGNPRMATVREQVDRGYHLWERFDDGVRSWSATYLTTAQVDDALALMAELPEPWFIEVAFSAPHEPWDLPPPELYTLGFGHEASDARDYGRVVEALDREVGRLMASVSDDTTVMLLSDNGTPGEAITEPWDPDRGKHTIYDGGIRVPLIVRAPSVVEPGREVDALVHLVDVFATAADLAGVDLRTAPHHVDGHSWLPLLSDPDAAPLRSFLFTEQFQDNGDGPHWRDERAITDGRWKLVDWSGADVLFDGETGMWDEGAHLVDEAVTEDAWDALARLRPLLRTCPEG